MPLLSRFTIELRDADGGRIQTSFDGEPYALDGSNHALLLSAQDALSDAIESITLGQVQSVLIGGNYQKFNVPNATTQNAQTNIQWRLFAKDTVTDAKFTTRIGTADLSVSTNFIMPDGSETTILDLTSFPGDALKSAFDALVYSPEGNPAELISVVYVQ